MDCLCSEFSRKGICWHTGRQPEFPYYLRKEIKNKVTDILDELNKDFAEGWRPSEGDVLVGNVTDVSKGWSDQSEEFYPIVTVQDENSNSEKAIHCFHYVLKNKMIELKPQISEKIAVKFTGETPTKDGRRTFKTYKVAIQGRNSAQSVWDSMDSNKPDPVLAAAQEAVNDKQDDEDIPF